MDIQDAAMCEILLNSAAMNIKVCVFFQIIISSGNPKSGIAGSYRLTLFLRNLHAVLHCGCTNLFPPTVQEGSFFSILSLQHLLFLNFLITAILSSKRWYLTKAWICISLTVILSIFTCMSSLETSIFRSSAHFLIFLKY